MLFFCGFVFFASSNIIEGEGRPELNQMYFVSELQSVLVTTTYQFKSREKNIKNIYIIIIAGGVLFGS